MSIIDIDVTTGNSIDIDVTSGGITEINSNNGDVTNVDVNTENKAEIDAVNVGGPKGEKGDPGESGVPGPGVPVGGLTGDVLVKSSTSNYDTEWSGSLSSALSKLSGIENGAQVNVQSDWNQTNDTADDYIKNKPSIPSRTSDLFNDSYFPSDANYNHTDNNYTTEEKNKLASLSNYDDTALSNRVTTIEGEIPSQASSSNQLADKAFVNSSVQTATANFRGNWTDWANVPTVATDYPVDYAGNTTPTVNDYLVVQDASDYTLDTLEGTWRFKYTGTWSVDGKAGWNPEYQVNETPLTAAQLAALNSGITAGLVANIPAAPNIVITLGVDGGGNMVWSGADSISDVRNAFNNGGSLRVEAPLLTDELYNVTEVWWKDSNHDTLIVQSVDNDAALIQIGLVNDYSVEMDNVNLQERLQAGANITINGNVISASVPTITVDSALDNTSTNPVQNQALYTAIVGKDITFSVPANAWSEPSGTNPYKTVAIVTLPAGSFTDNCTIELTIGDKFNDFAEYGFVLYSAEVASQRIWLTAMKKPTSQIYLTVKVYTYGS